MPTEPTESRRPESAAETEQTAAEESGCVKFESQDAALRYAANATAERAISHGRQEGDEEAWVIQSPENGGYGGEPRFYVEFETPLVRNFESVVARFCNGRRLRSVE